MRDGFQFASPLDAVQWVIGPHAPYLEDAPPPPLVNRCACGRIISEHRTHCLECGVNAVKRIASCITTTEALRAFLEDKPEQDHAAILELLAPHLQISDLPMVSPASQAEDGAPGEPAEADAPSETAEVQSAMD